MKLITLGSANLRSNNWNIILKKQLRLPLTILAVILTLLPACHDGSANPTASVKLNVLAAASLTNAITEINAAYTSMRPWVTIVPNFAGSSTLQIQIEHGGACDVFFSAATAQMDNLQNKGWLIDGTRRDILSNKLVLIVPSNSTLGLTSFTDLALPKVSMISIGDPGSVPAGAYAKQAFDLLGITTQVQSKYLLGADVRGVLAHVESGSVSAGVIYATDALISDKVKVVASAPDAINAKIVYPAAVTKNSRNQAEAQEYINFLASEQAMTIFAKYGFSQAVQ